MDDGGIKKILFGIEITVLGGVLVLSGGGIIGVSVAVAGLFVSLYGLGTPTPSEHPEDQQVP